MEIIRPPARKTYRTRRKKVPAQPKSYRVVSEEVGGTTFRRWEFTLRWAPLVMGGVLTVTLLLAYSSVRNLWLAGRIADESCLNQMLWTQPDPGWRTPAVDQELLMLCYQREKMF